MKAEQKLASFKEAKNFYLVEFIFIFGFDPTKIQNNNYKYHPPP
jgi:hypothetical protein